MTNKRRVASTSTNKKPDKDEVKKYLKNLNGQVICDKCISSINNWDLETVIQMCDGLAASSTNPLLRRSSSAGCNFGTTSSCKNHHKSKVCPSYIKHDADLNSIITFLLTESGASEDHGSDQNPLAYKGEIARVRTHMLYEESHKELDRFLDTLVYNFIETANRIPGILLQAKDFQIDSFSRPHPQPKELTPDQQAIYMFCDTGGMFLKIGKVGPGSKTRYTSNHYTYPNPTTDKKGNKIIKGSLLARVLVDDSFFNPEELIGLELTKKKAQIGDWMKGNLWRANIILNRHRGGARILSLFESYLHVRFHPLYEKS